MLGLFQKKSTEGFISKRFITVTATLISILKPGLPAIYLYQGNLIRTSTVQAILEAAPNHVQFETENSIYTIAFFNQPETDANLIA